MDELLIHSNRCWVENRLIEATIHIDKQKISAVYMGSHMLSGIRFLTVGNSIVMPGIIDAHVHINEPGRTKWEGFETATRAAALGGVTTLIEMPLNANPVTTTVAAFEIKKKATKNKLHVNCGFYGGVIPGNEQDIEGLIQAGVFGIKGFLIHSGIDEFPNTNKEQLAVIAPILAKHHIPLLLHCELADELVPKIENPKSYKVYLNSRPQRWEINAIELALELQQIYNLKVHIVHLSASEAINRIKKRKRNTTKLTVETCAHYLFFDAESIPDAAPIYKCAPPIREKKNNDLLWNYLLEDGFNFLTSDHSPAPPDIKKLKEGNLFEAWGGIAGLQFILPVLWTAGIKRGLTIEKLIPLLTINAAIFLGLEHRKGLLKKGYDADITIWDEKERFVIDEKSIAHRHKETPYSNQILKGKIIHTFVNGVHVVNNKELEVEAAGMLLLKNRTAEIHNS